MNVLDWTTFAMTTLSAPISKELTNVLVKMVTMEMVLLVKVEK